MNKKELCIRCNEEAEIETERGMLCNSCDCERLSRINNTQNEKTEEDFWGECK